MISYHNKRFKPSVNSSDGDVDTSTVFEYFERNGIVWATYSGGNILFGTLIARKLEGGPLDMHYSLFTTDGKYKAGICESTPVVGENGALSLHEK